MSLLRRKMVVAFEECVNRNDRLFYAMAGNPTPEEIVRLARERPGKGRFYCAADRPTEKNTDDFALRAVYRTTKVPTDAECEQCGINIRALQDQLTESLGG